MFERGKIILIPFPFTDLSSQKIRPALIISPLRQRASDIIVAFIGSSVPSKPSRSEVVVEATKATGLKTDSCIRCDKIATLDRHIALGEIGSLSTQNMHEVNKALSVILGI